MSAVYDEELVPCPGPKLYTPYVTHLNYEQKLLEDRAVRRLMQVARRHGVDSPEVHRALRVWESIIYGDNGDENGSTGS